jgi:SAM-dependent methyltransferase
MLAGLIGEGMTVLEPGPGMGFFTLDLARLVGPKGRVITVDVQPRILASLPRRAGRAGLLDRLDLRLVDGGSLGVSDLRGKVDFALAFAMVHEVPNVGKFFSEIAAALGPEGKLLFSEPSWHVARSFSIGNCRQRLNQDSSWKAGLRSLLAAPRSLGKSVLS